MNALDIHDENYIVPKVHDRTNYPFYNEGEALHVFDAEGFHKNELLFDNDKSIDVLPTILEEEGFRELNDLSEDPTPDLPVVECKKNFPLRLSRKPKQRLPFPVHREEILDTIVDPWMLEPDRANISYVVPREMKSIDLKENSTFIRWEIYPRITDADVQEFYKENYNPDVEDMRLGVVEFDFDDLPDIPRRKEEMNIEMLLNYFDDLEIREEFLAKTREDVYNPHLPWFKQKHLRRRERTISQKKLLGERIEKGEIVEQEVPKGEDKTWSPWKIAKASSGRGRQSRSMRWRHTTSYTRDQNEMNKTPGTEDRGRGSFRNTRYRGRRGYVINRGGRGDWGGEGGEDKSGGWGTGSGGWGGGDQDGGYGRSSWRGRRGGWGSGDSGGGRESWGGTDTSGGGDEVDPSGVRGRWGGGRGWGGWGNQSRRQPRGIYRRGVMAGRGRVGGELDTPVVEDWED